MSHFYVLKPDRDQLFGTKWAYGEVAKPKTYGDAEQCPVCRGPVSMRHWLPPHRLTLSSAQPQKWGDFLWGAGFPLMLSLRFKRAYEVEGLTGITHFYAPAEIVRVGKRKTGDLPDDLTQYRLVDIMWNGANLDDIQSGAVREQVTCEFHRGAITSLQRIVLEQGSWGGADIFVARGLPGRIIVSEQFKNMIQKFDLTNAWLVPAERYAYDENRPGGWYLHTEEQEN